MRSLTSFLTLTALAMAASGALAQTPAKTGPEFTFSGFGTVGVVHSDDRNGDYVGSRFQPNGAGRTRSTDFGPDTKLGGQLSAKFGDQLSAVVQVVAQHQYDNSYKPMLEWANVKYEVVPGFSLRAGRIALPSYLLSESRYVGYANPWAHPPGEVYSVLAVTSNDGVDATWRKQFGSANNTLQGFYGRSSSKLPTGKVNSDATWGFNDTVEIGALTVRAGYTSIKLDLELSSLDPLFGGLSQFATAAGSVPAPAFQSAAAQARALLSKYSLKDMKLSAVVLGLNYDPGEWFVMSEFVAFKGDSFLSDSTSWYVSGGWRIGSFTPFVSFANTRSHFDAEPGIQAQGTPLAAGAAGLNAGLNTTLLQFNGSQDTVAAGLRWDAVRNVALKAQVEQTRLRDASNGRFANFAEGGRMGDKVNLVSLTVDFVF